MLPKVIILASCATALVTDDAQTRPTVETVAQNVQNAPVPLTVSDLQQELLGMFLDSSNA
jgi:hypothetical protein